MKNNQEVQIDIQNSVKWVRKLHALALGVKAKNGLVSIKRERDISPKKIESRRTSLDLTKENQLTENKEIGSPNFKQKSDAEVAFEVLAALKANTSVPNDTITVKVDKGWVTLNGDLPFNYQREATKSAVKNLGGVKCVTINIRTKSHLNNSIEKIPDNDQFMKERAVNFYGLIAP